MLVKVWNDNDFLYTEKYQGKPLTIEPKSFIEMDEDAAEQFLGQYVMPRKRGDGTDDPAYFKMLRIHPPLGERQKPASTLMHHATGRVASSEEELKEMTKAFAHLLHKDKGLDEKIEAERAEKFSTLEDANAQLRSDIADLKKSFEEVLAMRGKGTRKHQDHAEAI